MQRLQVFTGRFLLFTTFGSWESYMMKSSFGQWSAIQSNSTATGAQTERRGEAGPVSALLGREDSPTNHSLEAAVACRPYIARIGERPALHALVYCKSAGPAVPCLETCGNSYLAASYDDLPT
jgi:hypothetical protein